MVALTQPEFNELVQEIGLRLGGEVVEDSTIRTSSGDDIHCAYKPGDKLFIGTIREGRSAFPAPHAAEKLLSHNIGFPFTGVIYGFDPVTELFCAMTFINTETNAGRDLATAIAMQLVGLQVNWKIAKEQV